MVYRLCSVYARCSKPVSIPAPVYYAHLACKRAAHLVELCQWCVFFENKATLFVLILELVCRQNRLETIGDKKRGETDAAYDARVQCHCALMEQTIKPHVNLPEMYFV